MRHWKAVKIVVIVAILVGSLVTVWLSHQRIKRSRETLALYRRNRDLKDSLVRSGEVCVTFDEKYLIKQHWRPVIYRIGGQDAKSCYASAPTGLNSGEVNERITRRTEKARRMLIFSLVFAVVSIAFLFALWPSLRRPQSEPEVDQVDHEGLEMDMVSISEKVWNRAEETMRERCAKIAEAHENEHCGVRCGEIIAAKIRGGE